MTVTMVKTLIVCILDRHIYNECQHFYDGVHGLEIVYGNIFQHKADCFVTAGNSFGMMDGGIDNNVNYFFDYIQSDVQQAIMDHWRGECPVGASVMLPVKRNAMGCKYLCYAPTMRMPQVVSKTNNAYLAARAALIECSRIPSINTIIMPMLCLGVGRMPPATVLHQIKCAWQSFHSPCLCNWTAINKFEQVLNDEDV